MDTRAVIAFLLICIPPVAAQVRAGADAVVVPVTVTDPSGHFVRGLTADQFEIEEGGIPREIVRFSADRGPISLGILIDISGIITDDPTIRAGQRARWANMRRALELLLTRLDPADEVFLSVFNETIAAGSWTQDHVALLREFDALRPGGGNVLLDAVTSIVPTFELGRHHRRVLLVISDGNDGNVHTSTLVPSDVTSGVAPPGYEPLTMLGESRETVRQRRISATKSAVRRSDVMLYAIGIGRRTGEPVDTVLLEGLTAESGGYVESVRDPVELAEAVGRICDNLQSQYVLGFARGQADGKYHSIKVRTKIPKLRVRARGGYVAPPASTR